MNRALYKGMWLSDDRARAEAFNKYFQSTFKDHSSCISPEFCPIHPDISMPLETIQVSCEEVFSILSSLNVAKATGPDNLPAIILKNCADALAPSLTVFFNASFSTGLYLTEWKQANIPPIYKKGNRSEVENYRQVSLLPIVSKVQERCVAKRLVSHVSPVLHPRKFGFRHGFSCTSQLTEVFYDICSSLDKGFDMEID